MEYKIPLFDLNIGQEEEDAIIETLRSNWISSGPKCVEFEKEFSKLLDVRYSLTQANCTVALHLALVALSIKEGDEVIVPSLTFAATANCVKYVGATPIFADIVGYDDLTISPEDIEAKITAKTKAIIVMHYGGFPCRMDEIISIAQKHNLIIVEDASHSPLSEYKGKKLGAIGDIGCFSFFSNKNISTGEGGMLVTNNQELFEKTKLLRSHGMTSMSYERSKGHATQYDINLIGYNYRMDDIRASIGIAQLRKIKNDLKKREQIRQLYLNELANNDNIIIPFSSNNEFVSNYIMPVVLPNSDIARREKIRNALHEKGIQTSNHYPAVHLFSCYKYLDAKLPISEYVSDNEITLPMYGSLSEDSVKFICGALKDLIRE